MSKKYRYLIAGAAVAALVAIPLLAKAGRLSLRRSERDSFVALKERRDCARSAAEAHMKELEAGWQIHQTARAEALAAYNDAVAMANDLYHPCLAVKDEETCEERRGSARKQATADLAAARAAARSAWRDARKKGTADYKTAKAACKKK
jgi:hypothetical protein